MNERSATSTLQHQPLREVHQLLTILAITALTYLGTLRFDFVSDDSLQIADNRFIKSWRYVPHFFFTSVWAHLYPHSPRIYYRPIYLFWNLVNYSLFGVNPMGWHATAILLHLLVTVLVFKLTRSLAPGRPALAWVTTLIFGVHPVHHEVVAWISGATESLYAAFFLAAFLAYLNSRARSRTAWMCASCALYGVAVFTKETAIVLPALVFAHSWIASRPDDQTGASERNARLRTAAGTALLYAPAAAIYLAMRFWVLSGFGHIIVSVSAVGLVSTWPSVLLFYLKHWLLPVGYAADYDMAYYSGWQLLGVGLPAAVLACVAAGLWLGKHRLGARETDYAAVWMIVPLLPVLDLGVFHLGEFAHDRYFYVPSIGAALLVALLLEPIGRSGSQVWGQPRLLVITSLLLAVALSLFTVAAAGQWTNNLVLLTRAHQFAPINPTVRTNLSVEWIGLGRLDYAQALLEPVVREAPEEWLAWLNLARVQYQKQDYAAAERDLRQTIMVNPDSGLAYVLLGQTQLKTNRMPEALSSIRRGVELLPQEYRFHVIYGISLEMSGDCPSAMIQFSTALTLQPGDEVSQRELDHCRAAGRSSLKEQGLPLPLAKGLP
jgi:protein O-mannosyl-transferase